MLTMGMDREFVFAAVLPSAVRSRICSTERGWHALLMARLGVEG
jgi:hypothetical protein